MAHIQQFVEPIRNSGATLLAISPEKPEYSRKIIGTQKLTFDILFDRGSDVAEQYGLRFSLPEDLKQLYRDSFNVNLKLYHGDDNWTLPMPARFVIDQQGLIRYAESCVDYRFRPEMDEVIAALQSLGSSGATS